VCLPTTVHNSGVSLPWAGSSRAGLPRLQRYYQDTTTSCCSSRITSFPSLGGTKNAHNYVRFSRCYRMPNIGPGIVQPVTLSRSTYIRLFSLETTGPLKFPENLICTFAHAPATPDGQALQAIRRRPYCPRLFNDEDPDESLSRLNNMAFALAVYASQCRLPDAHARLAPGCLAKLDRTGLSPAKIPTKGFP
jgi:hypothetical protein